jgi:hypothetical protein
VEISTASCPTVRALRIVVQQFREILAAQQGGSGGSPPSNISIWTMPSPK